MSAGLQLDDRVVAAFRDRLTVAALNAEVAVANGDPPADLDETYRLDLFEDGSVGDHLPPPSAVARFPFVGVQSIGGELADDLAWSATGVHRLGLVIIYSHADPASLQRRLRRYLRCLARVALVDRRFDTTEPWMRVLGFDYGPPLALVGGSDDYVSWARLTVECRQDEE